MRKNETFTYYEGDGDNAGFHLRTYDTEVDFEHRNLFEHKHSDLEISLVLSGGGLYHFRDRVCRFQAGDVFIFGSNQMHCITDVDVGVPTSMFGMQIEASLFWSGGARLLNEGHLQLFNDRCLHFPKESPVTERMRARLEELRTESVTRQVGYEVRMYACLLSLVGILIAEYGDALPQEKKRTDYAGMERAVQYINEHLSESFSLEDIAHHAGYSRSYFSALFTQLNGLSPWDYITIKRIALSRALLRTTELPVTEIAGRSGYANLSNFNQHFKRLTGCSPREYLARHRQAVKHTEKEIQFTEESNERK